LLSQFVTPEFNALFRQECLSLRGKVRFTAQSHGVVTAIVSKVRQLFQRLPATPPQLAYDHRFAYFTKEMMPKIQKVR
jgi:hypothetical protein